MELYDHEQHGSIEEWLLQRRSWELANTFTDQITNYDHLDGLLSATTTANLVDATLTPSPFDYYNLGCYSNFVTGGEAFSSELGSSFDGYYDLYGGNQFQLVSESSYDQAVQLSAPTTVADNSSYGLGGYPMMSAMEEEEETFADELAAGVELLGNCKTEPVVSSDQSVDGGGQVQVVGGQRISGRKRAEGQPSKNLMAERRRRKRLNDRLSMLRSIVPKISKMDRTSILGDTIDYMKELLDKIQKLQEEIIESGSDQQSNNIVQLLKDMKPNEMVVRNSPKFNVERRDDEEMTRVEMCCSGKPGLLLSTVNTLEVLGLEIQQCVISCFSDFALQASCSQEVEQRQVMSTEDIKQALFRNAGYGGKCL